MRRVLIVDDDPGIIALTRAVLTAENTAIRTATSGEEALALLACEPADVVVLDIEMSGISGWETLRAIRDDPDLAEARVVIHSATSPLTPPTPAYPVPDRVVSKPSPVRLLVEAVQHA